MATKGKISDLFDVEGIKEQYDQVISLVQGYVKEVEKAGEIRVRGDDAKSVKDKVAAINDLAEATKRQQTAADNAIGAQDRLAKMTSAVDKGSQALAASQKKVTESIRGVTEANKTAESSYKELLDLAVQNELASKQLAASKKLLNEEYKNGNVSQEEYLRVLADLKDQQLQLTTQGRDLQTSLRNLAKDANSAESSLDAMKARLALLQQAYSKLSDQEKASPIGKEIQKQTRALADSINEQKKAIGDFSSNVGRYTESLGSGFENVRREIVRLQKEADHLTISGDTRGVEAAQRSIGELDNIIKVSMDSNKSYQQTVRALEIQFKNMATSGNQSEEFLKEFQKFVAQAKHESNELTQSIKALSSETRGLDLVTGGISTIASLFETGAGAAALFGANTEATEKTIQKLVAVQSVANGVREIAKQLTEKETLAGKAYVFVQKLVATATDSSATATTRWGAALKLIGIGAIVAGVAWLVDKLDLFSDSSKEAEEASKKLTESIKSQNEAIQQNIDLIARDYDESLSKLKKQYDIASASGKDQLTLFAIKKQIAEREKKLADDQLAAQIKAADNLSGTITNGKRGLEGLVIAQAKYKDQVTQLNDAIVASEKKKSELIKDGNTDAADDVQLYIDKLKELKGTADESYQGITKSLNDAADAQAALSKLQAEEAKFRADERRKVVLASIQLETQATIDSNERILANEKSTLAQRLESVNKIAAAQKRAAEAQKNAILSDPSKIGTAEYTLAVKNFNASVNKITADSQKQRADIIEAFRIRDLQAEVEYKNQILGVYADLNDKLAQSDKLSLEERLRARDRYLKAQTEQVNNEFKLQLQQAGISDQEIAALEKDRNYRVKSAKLTQEEIEALEIDHETKLAQIASNGADQVTAIIISSLEQQKKARIKGVDELERLASFTGIDNSKAYADEIISLNTLYKQKKISLEKYQKERIALEHKYNLLSLNDAIATLTKELELLSGSENEEIRAREKLELAKRELDAATTEEARKQALKRMEIAEAEYEFARELADRKKKVEKDLADAKKELSEAAAKKATDDKNKDLDTIAQYAKTANDILTAGFSAISEARGIFYDKEIAYIEEATAALNAKKEKDLEVANATITNEADKAKAIAEINARAQAQQDVLEKRRRQAEIEKARFEKAKNIADIISSTALAVVNALKADDVPGPLRIPLAISIGALGAAQLARAIAAPLPRFFRGKDAQDGYEGYAVVDDEPWGRGGRPETIIRENGEVEKGGYKPRVTWIGKNDQIIPHGRKNEKSAPAIAVKADRQADYVDPFYRKQVQLPDVETTYRLAISAIHRSNDRRAEAYVPPVFDDSKIIGELRKMRSEISVMTSAVQNIKGLNLDITERGIAAMYEQGAKITKYINDQTNWSK